MVSHKLQLNTVLTLPCSTQIGIYPIVILEGFPGESVVKKYACNAGDMGSIPGSGRWPGEGNGNPLQYSCLGNPMVRGAWRTIVHGVTRVKHDLGTYLSLIEGLRKIPLSQTKMWKLKVDQQGSDFVEERIFLCITYTRKTVIYIFVCFLLFFFIYCY